MIGREVMDVDKRERIVDALGELFEEGRAGTASVSDIARRAGIAKGGLYYYFRSKEEVLDALVAREYAGIIAACEREVERSDGSALEKLALLLRSYRGSYVDPSLDECLHAPSNAAIHQKSLAQILVALSPIVARLIEQGVDEGTFSCAHPEGCADIMLSVFAFLLDPGIFAWTDEERAERLQALAELLERGLGAPEGSFAFLLAG